MDKELAARKAAAMYSTDPLGAFMKYVSLIGIKRSLSKAECNELQDEMYNLLPPYRHPVNCVEGEVMLFFDPECLQFSGTIHRMPPYISRLEEAGVDFDTIEAIKADIREAEQSKIDQNQLMPKLKELEEMFEDVQSVYDEFREDRSSTRNTKVVQTLEFSNGTRAKLHNHQKVYVDYVKLVRKKGLRRRIAVEELANQYAYSYDTIINILNEQKSLVIKKWKEIYPNSLPEIRKRLKGFVPQDR